MEVFVDRSAMAFGTYPFLLDGTEICNTSSCGLNLGNVYSAPAIVAAKNKQTQK
jgi:hypothetical protein